MTEVIVRFEPPAPGTDSAQEPVRGVVVVVGDEQESRHFTGWLQLLSHLETLSGDAAKSAADLTEPPDT